MPIRAGFSEDGSYVVCGSDSGAVFVWDAAPAEKAGRQRGREALRRDKIVACESFQVVFFKSVPVLVAAFECACQAILRAQAPAFAWRCAVTRSWPARVSGSFQGR